MINCIFITNKVTVNLNMFGASMIDMIDSNVNGDLTVAMQWNKKRLRYMEIR